VPDFELANGIGEFWGHPDPESRTFVALLIDCEEDRTLRPVLVVSYERELSSRTMGASRAPLSNPLHVAAAVVAEGLPLSPCERLPVPRPIRRLRVEDSVGVGPEPVARRRAEHLARPRIVGTPNSG
jgi:hypothetical protein